MKKQFLLFFIILSFVFAEDFNETKNDINETSETNQTESDLGDLVIESFKTKNSKLIIDDVLISLDDFILFKKKLSDTRLPKETIIQMYSKYKIVVYKNWENIFFLSQKNRIDWSKITFNNKTLFLNGEVSQKLGLQAAQKIVYNYNYLQKPFQIEFKKCVNSSSAWRCSDFRFVNLFDKGE